MFSLAVVSVMTQLGMDDVATKIIAFITALIELVYIGRLVLLKVLAIISKKDSPQLDEEIDKELEEDDRRDETEE